MIFFLFIKRRKKFKRKKFLAIKVQLFRHSQFWKNTSHGRVAMLYMQNVLRHKFTKNSIPLSFKHFYFKKTLFTGLAIWMWQWVLWVWIGTKDMESSLQRQTSAHVITELLRPLSSPNDSSSVWLILYDQPRETTVCQEFIFVGKAHTLIVD